MHNPYVCRYKAALALGRLAGALRRRGPAAGAKRMAPPVMAAEAAARPQTASGDRAPMAAAAAASAEHARERTKDYIERSLARRAVVS